MQQKIKKLKEYLQNHYGEKTDPWGLHPKRVLENFKKIWPIYHNYFDVRIHGKINVKKRPYMVVSNHTGQIPIDAILITTAFASELRFPRILRPLVERFLISLPFFGRWSNETGAVLGDRHNCLNLLKRGESVLVFPEGVKGISKNTKDFYKLQPFTRGFIRMAITSGVDILPVAVTGAEEFYPYVVQMKRLAKFLKLPALPLSPNLIPLPSPVDIFIGKAYSLPKNLSPDALDKELDEHILKIEKQIKMLLEEGLKKRRTIVARLKR